MMLKLLGLQDFLMAKVLLESAPLKILNVRMLKL